MKKWWALGAAAAILTVGAVVYSGVLGIRAESIRIDAGDVTLAGTLALPRGRSGPYPATVIVHGSGKTTRRDLRGYVRHLVPHGLAVLIYDKRGTGDSGGDYTSVGVEDGGAELRRLAGDAAAAFAALRRRDDIDPDRIGFLGGSQAGWIMPLAAAESDGAAFIVSISGPAVTVGQESHYSRLTGDDPGGPGDLEDDEIRRRMETFDGPHGYDPLPVLRSLRVPQLWVLGGRDPSVPTYLTLENLEPLRAREPDRIAIRLYPDGDHSLRHAETGRRLDYWPDIRDWLNDRGLLQVGASDTRRPGPDS